MDLHIILDIDQTLVDNMSIDEYNRNQDKYESSVNISNNNYMSKI